MPTLVLSDFAGAELASALSRRVRTGDLKPAEARKAFSDFDAWATRTTLRVETVSSDIAVATSYLRNLDLKLRTADAIHIAIAQRVAADLATFDVRMAEAAASLKTKLVPI
jgi:hypothetical protein